MATFIKGMMFIYVFMLHYFFLAITFVVLLPVPHTH